MNVNTGYDALFVTCGSQIEPLLLKELEELGLKGLRIGFRGVYVDVWNWDAIYLINYSSRLASRVLLPLLRFKCYDKVSLYKKTSEINWLPFFKEGTTFAIDSNVQHRELTNSLYAAQVVKDAICDQIRDKRGRRPSVDIQEPDIQLNLFVHQQNAVISFDTSGAPLHRRGYRVEGVEAPMQETLAAAILTLANYDQSKVLFDPFCGSGTLLIEAALMASKTPPGYLRRTWGFMRHPHFCSSDWLRVRNEVDAKRETLSPGYLFGMDKNPSAVKAAKLNLRAAGFSNVVEVLNGDFRYDAPPSEADFIVTNPPHGRRLEDEEQLVPLYRELGNFLKKNCKKPGKAFIFTGSLPLSKEVGLAATRKFVLNNGGVESRLLEYDIY